MDVFSVASWRRLAILELQGDAHSFTGCGIELQVGA